MQELDNQYFTYRQSPALVNGKARIKSIKGNTLVWNQLRSPIVGSSSPSGITGTFTADGKCVFTGTSTGANVFVLGRNIPMCVNHKYLILFNKTLDANRNIQLRYSADGTTDSGGYLANIYNSTIFTYTNSTYPYVLLRFYFGNGVTLNDTFYISMYDLTMIFGSGKEPSSVSEFKQYYPLDYYAYNSGSLLNFNGTGIKTTGKNLLPFELANIKSLNTSGTWNDNVYTLNGLVFTINSDGTVKVSGTSTAVTVLDFLVNSKNIYVGCKISGSNQTTDQQAVAVQFLDENNVYQNSIALANGNEGTMLNYPKCTVRIRIGNAQTLNNAVFYPMIRFSDTDSAFEPYTSSTLSLPISTYFPTGMKSAGSVYDELTESKAITRVLETVVDGTNKVASYYGTFEGHQLFYVDVFSNTSASAEFDMCLVSNKYTTYDVATMPDKGIRYQGVPAQTINIGRVYWTDDSYTSASAMNTALQSSPLVINSVLATYTEQGVDPIYYDFYGNGTEQLLPANGSTPTTSPILMDMAYSSGILVLTTFPEPTQGGTTTGDGTYLIGEEATVTATPNEHWAFKNWELEGEIVSTDAEYTFEVE